MKTQLITLSVVLAALCACTQPTPRQKAEKEAEVKARELLSQLTVEEKASLLVYNSPAVERVGIKSYNWWNEALHGVARNGAATVFPQPIGMAASFDEPLLEEVFTAVSDEARIRPKKAAGIRDLRSGHPTSIFSGIPAGAAEWRLTVRIRTSRA